MTISAVIPAYNRAHCIARALDSIFAQTQAVDEVLVVDDGSTDNLAITLQPFADRIRVVRHLTNQGAAAARNTGIREAKGDYIAFLDSDDTWMPDKTARQTAFMREKALDASCANFELVAPGQKIGRLARRPYDSVLRLPDVVWGCYISPGSTLMCKRELLLDVGGYDIAFPRYEDWDLLLKIALKKCEIGFLPDAMARIHLGMNFAPQQADAGLDMILARYTGKLGHAKMERRLKSAVAFNRASVQKAAGNPFGMTAELARSLYLHPFGHFPIQVILLGALKRMF